MIRIATLVLASLCAISTTLFAQTAEDIRIIAGKAKIEGRVKTAKQFTPNSLTMEVILPHNISGKVVNKTAIVNENGSFSFELDIETDYTIFLLSTNFNDYRKFIGKLYNDKITHVEIEFDENRFISNVHISESFTQNELTNSYEAIIEMETLMPDDPIKDFNKMKPNEFSQHLQSSLEQRNPILRNNILIAADLKDLMEEDFKYYFYTVRAFDYERIMRNNHLNVYNTDLDDSKLQVLDLSYFDFLKKFQLNKTPSLQYISYHPFQRAILTQNTLNIPEIGETEIAKWLGEVKSILSEALGFKDSWYYDVLAANAFGMQIFENEKPLTEQQINNIKTYWKGTDIEQILLREHDSLIKK